MAMAANTNMRDVVQQLRAEQNEAFAELKEFDGAIHEVQRHLETLVRATREFARDMQKLVLPGSDVAIARLRALRDETARMNEMAMLLLAAYGEICLGVQGWDVRGELDHASS